MRAFKIVLEANPSLHLVLVGSKKNNFTKVVNEIINLGIKDSVSILGYVENDILYNLYKKARAMVYVSFLGPTNIPPLEAIYLGCPLICSDVYAMREQSKDCALYVNPNDINDIATKISYILNDAEVIKELLTNGQFYNKENRKESFDIILHKLLKDCLEQNY